MTPKFKDGSLVRFNDAVCKMAPQYIGRVYTILAATAAWGIGEANEWYGDYLVFDENGAKSVVRETTLVAA